MRRTKAIVGVVGVLVGGCAGQTPDDSGPGDTNDGAAITSATCGQMADVWDVVEGAVGLPGDLGKVLACDRVASFSAAQVSLSTQYLWHGWTAENGYELFVIQYVSQGPVGTARRASALVYLPTGVEGPLPLVAVNHGTNGLGPHCGPSKASWVVDYMAMPLAGRGYAVVAADYPGMGVDEGVYSYGVGEAEALSILDGVRALKRFDDRVGTDLFLLGHSQGGQATLFAHDLYETSLGVDLLGSVTVAPGLGDLRGMNLLLGHPDRAMDMSTLFYTMIFYSAASYYGGPQPSAWLTSEAAAELPGMLHDQCWAALYTSVPAAFPTQGDLFSAAFLNEAASCPFYASECAGFDPWEGYLRDQVPGAFDSDVPALVIQGDQDTVVPPYLTACVAERLRASGTPVTTCGYASADHTTIVDVSADHWLAWMAARRAGTTPPACASAITTECP